MNTQLTTKNMTSAEWFAFQLANDVDVEDIELIEKCDGWKLFKYTFSYRSS